MKTDFPVHADFFRNLRSSCCVVASQWAEENDLMIDLGSIKLIPMGKFTWEASFESLTLGGANKVVFVHAWRRYESEDIVVSAAGMNFCVRVRFNGVATEIAKVRDARPKSQGQTVSDAVHANWKAAQKQEDEITRLRGEVAALQAKVARLQDEKARGAL